MNHQSVDEIAAIERVVYQYGDMLFRICFIMLGNIADAEDVVQETMIGYMQKRPVFASVDHEKAWLITTARNKCRDMMRFRMRHPQIELEELQIIAPELEEQGILESLMYLPEKYRIVLVLYYVEDYRINEIAAMLHKSPSAIKMRLQKGRKLMEEKLRKEQR